MTLPQKDTQIKDSETALFLVSSNIKNSNRPSIHRVLFPTLVVVAFTVAMTVVLEGKKGGDNPNYNGYTGGKNEMQQSIRVENPLIKKPIIRIKDYEGAISQIRGSVDYLAERTSELKALGTEDALFTLAHIQNLQAKFHSEFVEQDKVFSLNAHQDKEKALKTFFEETEMLSKQLVNDVAEPRNRLKTPKRNEAADF